MSPQQPSCGYCGATGGTMHRDHIVPASRGGGDEAHNCVVACAKCNLEKSDRTPSEWRPQGLPSWIYDSEKTLVLRYRMKARARRGPARGAEDALVECDVCGREEELEKAGSWRLAVVHRYPLEAKARSVVEWVGYACDGAGEVTDPRFTCGERQKRIVKRDDEVHLFALGDHPLAELRGDAAWIHLRDLHFSHVWPNEMFDRLTVILQQWSKLDETDETRQGLAVRELFLR